MPPPWTDDTETPPYGSPPWTPPSSPPLAPPVAPPAAPPSAPPPGYPPTYQPPWQPGPPPPAGPPGPHKQSGWLLALVVGVVSALLMFTLFGGLRYWASATSGSSSTGRSSALPVPSTTTPSVGSPSPGSPSTTTTVPSSGSSPQSWPEVAAAVDPGVVDIESLLPQGVGAGTGMVITDSGEILTNNHVVDGATRIVVTIAMTGESYRATVVGTNPSEDVAVLQLSNASGLTTIPLGDSDTVRMGDDIAAIGNAGGKGGEPDVAVGTVIGLHEQVTAGDQYGNDTETLTDMIHVRADVVPGDSGGPLVNDEGKVVGMNTAASAGRSRFHTSTNEAFAIPINRALHIAQQLEANPSSSSRASGAFLGVQVVTAASGGAQVEGVQSGSPAEMAGLHVGDVITSVGGTTISSAPDLVSAIGKHAPNEEVVVVWQSANGKRHQARVMLTSG